MKKRISIVACVIFLFGVFPTQADDRASWRLKTNEDAVNAALAYTGFTELKEYSLDPAKSTVVRIENDQTPFLKDSINSRQLWQVNFDSVRLVLDVQLESGEIVQRVDSNLRDFSVFWDPNSGQIVKISPEPDEDYPHKPPKPSVEQAEKQLSSLGPKKEFYHGFPNEPPKVTFLEALRSVLNDPFSAKEIHALYVMHSRGNGTPRPVWIIDLRGLDPAPPTISHLGANVPIEERNHMRNGVDAMTGAHLFTTTTPQVPVRDTTRR